MRRRLFGILLLALAGAGIFYLITRPRVLGAEEIAAIPQGDAAAGETWFWAGGCASCHAAEKAEGDERLKLGGGRVLRTAFGDFVAPNISSHPDDGIGNWTTAELANAMLRGVSPDGRHLYPAFPYASYIRMKTQDIADLRAFLATLPAVVGKAPGNSLKFPFSFRRGVGLWKLAFLTDAPAVEIDGSDPQAVRGQYLVEGPGHCGECHTPRNSGGAMQFGRWLAGAPAAEGTGTVPNITGGEGGIGDWSASDIAYFLESGFLPDFDSVGGLMVEVQENFAMLEAADREAVAAYLKAVPAQASR